jgi:hypothetical protein
VSTKQLAHLLNKAGKAKQITSAFSPNSKKNKLDDNTAIFSAQSRHHQLTLFWSGKLLDPNKNEFNWPIMKQIDNQGEFAINYLFMEEKKSTRPR